MTEKLIGEVAHYYSKISIGLVKLKDSLVIGEKIKVKEGDQVYKL